MDNTTRTRLISKLIQDIPEDVLNNLVNIKEILYQYGILLRLVERNNEKARKREWKLNHKDKVKASNDKNNAKRKLLK